MRLLPRPYFEFDSIHTLPERRIGKCGAVLFEVLVALALFVGAAAIITTGLNASLNSVERLRLSAHAADLAISTLSDLQIGIKTVALSGPQPFEAPFERWTWEIVTAPVEIESTEASQFTRVEVVVRHDEPALAYRLSQLLRIGDIKPGQESEASVEDVAF
jgi:hypothetical protein